MALPDAYSLKTNSIAKYFQALLTLPVPEVFDAAFFSDIGFRYAIDRSFIDILKELHFLDADGRPTRRYFEFHDGIVASDALLDGIREAYGRLLETVPDACAQPQKQIFETLKTLYAGSKPDMMVLGIAKTFVALCQYAEEIDRNPPPLHAAMEVQVKDAGRSEPGATSGPAARERVPETPTPQPEPAAKRLSIRGTSDVDGQPRTVNFVLPETRDPAVYEAIFASFKRQLLKPE